MNIKASHNVKYTGNRRFVLLPELKFDVKTGRSGDIVFPAGTKNVWCSFRTSHISYTKPETGAVENLNVYMKNGIIVHA